MNVSTSTATAASLWEATQYQNLFRYKPSGSLYARFEVKGKPIRKSLHTPDVELGRRRLVDLLKQEQTTAHARRRGRLNFGEAVNR